MEGEENEWNECMNKYLVEGFHHDHDHDDDKEASLFTSQYLHTPKSLFIRSS